MDLQLQNKAALVTGATAGIGLAIAQELAREGAAVTITGRAQDRIQRALDTIGNGGKGIVADLSNLPGTEPLFAQLPRVDILVNNLGIYEPKEFVDITDEDWLRFFQVNVMSGVRLARQYLPGMLARNWGRLIFISSEAGIQTPPEMIHYGMTKSAQLAISRGLAETTKGTGVTVNTIMPGPTKSEGSIQFLRNMSTNPEATDTELEREFFVKHRSASLLQRLIEAREIATMVAYLASPLSSATNGAAVRGCQYAGGSTSAQSKLLGKGPLPPSPWLHGRNAGVRRWKPRGAILVRVWRRILGGARMVEQGPGQTLAALAAATAIQTEVAHQRLALMWAQMVFDQLLKVWSRIEDHETLAYEDKVGFQVGLLQQASTNLWHFQRELAHTCRLLKDHQRQLKRVEAPESRAS
jgi:NAD(P)-dependent dehydrogenase (short-subunit alcohol dehydrogenase family)